MCEVAVGVRWMEARRMPASNPTDSVERVAGMSSGAELLALGSDTDGRWMLLSTNAGIWIGAPCKRWTEAWSTFAAGTERVLPVTDVNVRPLIEKPAVGNATLAAWTPSAVAGPRCRPSGLAAADMFCAVSVGMWR